ERPEVVGGGVDRGADDDVGGDEAESDERQQRCLPPAALAAARHAERAVDGADDEAEGGEHEDEGDQAGEEIHGPPPSGGWRWRRGGRARGLPPGSGSRKPLELWQISHGSGRRSTPRPATPRRGGGGGGGVPPASPPWGRGRIRARARTRE